MAKYKPTQLNANDDNYDAWCYNTGNTYEIFVLNKKDHKTIKFKLRVRSQSMYDLNSIALESVFLNEALAELKKVFEGKKCGCYPSCVKDAVLDELIKEYDV